MKMSTKDKLLTSIHHVGTLPVPTLQMRKVRLRKIHTAKKPLHPWQTGSRNCDIYYFVSLTSFKKPLKRPGHGDCIGVHTSRRLWDRCEGSERGLGCRIKREPVRRSPKRQFREPHCSVPPTQRRKGLRSWKPRNLRKSLQLSLY